MNSVSVEAPAKINLRLKVTGVRDDGYHLLSMLNEKLEVSDTLNIVITGPVAKFAENFPVEVECYDDVGGRMANLENESNLVIKAARRLSKAYNVSSPLKIVIKKQVPMGGGLGGGSSDAAATLFALNRLWGLKLSNELLAETGVTIGADVPFFLFDGPAWVKGIGEIVDNDVSIPKLWVLLINPGIHVSTPWAYKAFDLKLTPSSEDASLPRHFNDLDDLSRVIENDLEKVVLPEHPEIGSCKDYLQKRGARLIFMSGSGSTVVGIFGTKEERDRAVSGFTPGGWKFFSTENRRR